MSTDKEYTVENFVIDSNFRSWVLQPNTESNLFWEEWISKHPNKISEIKEARELILRMSRIDYQAKPETEHQIWEEILENLNEASSSRRVIPLSPDSVLSKHSSRQKFRFWSLTYSVAAAVLLLLSFVVLYQVGGNSYGSGARKTEIVRKTNPRGQKSVVIMPDGSKVYLNSESSIQYNASFENERVVALEGEAFFEVARDTLRPFSVTTKHMSTIALGTSFNVNSYHLGFTEVSLVTGKVRIVVNDESEREEILHPGELVQYSSEDRTLRKGVFDVEEKTFWRKNSLYLNNTAFTTAISMLERWYDVRFEISGSIPADTYCTGKFENEYLSNVLGSLSYTLNFDYRIEGRIVHLKFNDQNTMPMKKP